MESRRQDPFKFVRGRETRWTDDAIVDHYRGHPGMSTEDLALKAGVSGDTVRRVLRAAGLALPPRAGRRGPRKRLPEGVTETDIIDSYLSGLPAAAVADRFGLTSADIVYRLLKAHDIARRSSTFRKGWI